MLPTTYFRWLLASCCACWCAIAVGERPDPGKAALNAETLFATDRIVDVAIEIEAADWDKIRRQSRSIADALGEKAADSPFTYVEADVVIDGVRMERVGIRKKGFLGSLSERRPSLKIKFTEFEEKNAARAIGVDRLTLNNNKQDPSRLIQYLSYQFFNDSGTIAPRCNF
ncbi:MAG: CotH kinase family protein, partial [Planctomycetota bacterium]